MAGYKRNPGNDAATIRPKLVPDNDLLPRDDSGGLGYNPYTAQFGDGGYSPGLNEKKHLMPRGGGEAPMAGDQEDDARYKGALKGMRGLDTGPGSDIPESSKKYANE